MEFNKDDKHIADLYQKAMIKGEQKRKEFNERTDKEAQVELDKQFWGYLYARLKNVIYGVDMIEKQGIEPTAKIDKLKQDVSDLLTMTRMYTHPDVIAQLINEANAKVIKKRMLEKMKKE